MPRMIRRVKCLRMCDFLIAFIVTGNLLYVVYHINYDTPYIVVRQDSGDKVPTNEKALIGGNNSTSVRNIDKSQVKEEATVTKTSEMERIRETCPSQPPDLVGALACNCEPVTAESLTSQYPNIEVGGRLRPGTCKAHQRVAMIIPYRDRYSHLHSLLNMLIPILQRQQADVTFFVLEQTNDTYFNRAALQNIGFLESLKIADFDCFIFHDVDLVPLNDHNLYRCDHQPVHFAGKIKVGEGNYKTMYQEYTGGVIAFTRDHYQRINGNSNLYFGWGGEDDELYQRILNKNLTRIRANPEVAYYRMLGHARLELKRENPGRFQILKSAKQRQDIEGLNTCKYTVESIKYEHLYTWITVSLNATQVLLTAPLETLQDIKSMLTK